MKNLSQSNRTEYISKGLNPDEYREIDVVQPKNFTDLVGIDNITRSLPIRTWVWNDEDYSTYQTECDDFDDGYPHTDQVFEVLFSIQKPLATLPILVTPDKAEGMAKQYYMRANGFEEYEPRFVTKAFIKGYHANPAKWTDDDMMDIAGWMAAADNKISIHELKEEAEEYLKRKSRPQIRSVIVKVRGFIPIKGYVNTIELSTNNNQVEYQEIIYNK